MSLLMYDVSPERTVVMTDTLGYAPDGRPMLFTTKCSTVPHLSMAIAGTGDGVFVNRWRDRVNTGLVTCDIDNLDLHTPRCLREMWAGRDYALDGSGSTATVYHFGASREHGGQVLYAYRSTSGFESEVIPAGFGVKPVPLSGELPFRPADLTQMIELAQVIRAEQDSIPLNDRILIGGLLVVTMLSDVGIQTAPVFRFDDYDEAWQAMCDFSARGPQSD